MGGPWPPHLCVWLRHCWKVLWSLNVPNNFKSFAWRASKNILPRKLTMVTKRVLDNPTCEACGVAVESSGHFFWDCDKASEIWKLSGIPFDTRGEHFQDFRDLLWHVMFIQHFSDEVVCLFIIVACLWLQNPITYKCSNFYKRKMN